MSNTVDNATASRPNILLYFTDQQRPDTIGCYGQPLDITPRLDELAAEGVVFENAFTPQPVCGPCRAIFQTGRYAAEIGCAFNQVRLPGNIKTLGNYIEEAGYETGYIGKWHLASQGENLLLTVESIADQLRAAGEQLPELSAEDYADSFVEKGVPVALRGGYTGFWRVSDLLEYTSHGYDGYLFDENNNRIDFKGYRADCMTDFAMDFLNQWDGKKPFFLTISQLEPHHQNDRKTYEGPNGSCNRFAQFELPGDLKALGGNAAEMYPDYLGCCNSLDTNLGRLIDKLKKMGQYENTLIIYVSDHGSHFMTRNTDSHLRGADDYKRSCHDSALHVPLIISGPGFRGGRRIKDLVSTVSLPKTLLAAAGVEVGAAMRGEDMRKVADGTAQGHKDVVFAQISESRVGRCIRTPRWKYSVYAPDGDGMKDADSDIYEDDFLYNLEDDPFELNNLADDPSTFEIRTNLAKLLMDEMELAGEKRPVIRVGK